MKTRWIFMAYKKEEDYPDYPYFFRLFKNHERLKIFSGKHALMAKKTEKDYCSTYIKVEL